MDLFHLVFDPVYMVFDALHGVYMVERGVAQLDPRLAGEKNSPPCRPIYLHVEFFYMAIARDLHGDSKQNQIYLHGFTCRDAMRHVNCFTWGKPYVAM